DEAEAARRTASSHAEVALVTVALPPAAPTPVAEEAAAVEAAEPPVAVAQPAIEAAEELPVALDLDSVREVVLELVAEATGYPTDMLDPELDLEADLGVDTVKQAEIFVAIRGRYDIPRDESLKLRDFPTLSHVVQFVLDRAPAGAAPVTVEPVT